MKHTKFKFHTGVYAIILKNNKLLTVKKSRGPYTGLLDLPGGSIELYESIPSALIREVKEETGLDASILKLTAVKTIFYPHTVENIQLILKHTCILYTVLTTNYKVDKHINYEDICGHNWIDINDTSKNYTPVVNYIIKEIINENIC